MTSQNTVIVFDIVETVFSLETLRPKLVSAGLPHSALETWFTASLRDAFALAVTGRFAPFRSVLGGALADIMVRHRLAQDTVMISAILDGMKELQPRPDALDAFRHLSEAGFRIVALSNGSSSATEDLLKNGGLDIFVERVFSVEEVKLSKPRQEVYRHVAQALELQPKQLLLVAAHAWDTHGAKAAGLRTAFVSRGQPYPKVMLYPDIEVPELMAAAHMIIDSTTD